MVARYTSRGIFKEMEACKDFRVHSYGKVVLCGNSGAGKSTLTQVGCLMYGLIHTGNQGLQYYFLLYMYMFKPEAIYSVVRNISMYMYELN